MSARLRLGKFLSSPVCRIYGDKDIPEAEAETLQSGLGQEQTDRQTSYSEFQIRNNCLVKKY